MKKVLLAVMALSCLNACTVDIDWDYNGYAEIMNETSQKISVAVSIDPDSKYAGFYYLYPFIPRDGVIDKGESFKQFYWYNSQESIRNGTVPTIVSITLADGSVIECSSRYDTSWSRWFFDNSESRTGAEWSHFQRHEILIETFHIDDAMIHLWQRDH